MTSDESDDRYSDAIDSDIEIELYGAIHHKAFHDVSVVNHRNDHMNNKLMTIKDERRNDAVKRNYESDFTKLFTRNETKNDNSMKSPIQVIDLGDDDDDNDVIIISDDDDDEDDDDDNDDNVNIEKIKTPNLKLGNVSNLLDSTLRDMRKAYDEESYDSEEEMRIKNNMKSDVRLWRVNEIDFQVNSGRNKRYYLNKLICHNCKERGHMSRECPLPKKPPVCHLCGTNGHIFHKCKLIFCLKCHSDRHKTNECDVNLNDLLCSECGFYGHETSQCTNHWRKFHLTTSPDTEPMMNINGEKRNDRKSCYNCSEKHFGFECKYLRSNTYALPQSPLMERNQKSHNIYDIKHGKNRNVHSNDANSFIRNKNSSNATRLTQHHASTSKRFFPKRKKSQTRQPNNQIFNGFSLDLSINAPSGNAINESHRNGRKKWSYKRKNKNNKMNAQMNKSHSQLSINSIGEMSHKQRKSRMRKALRRKVKKEKLKNINFNGIKNGENIVKKRKKLKKE